MSTQVVSCWSRVPTREREPYYRLDAFLESLRRYAEVPVNTGASGFWQGLMTKPLLLREWLRKKENTFEQLIVCDSFDIIFTRHPHDIGDRCREKWGDAVVFNGERGCWPRADLADCFPQTSSPWRFLNSGFMCGPADKILEMVEAMGIDEIGLDRKAEDGSRIEPNDQGEYQRLYTEQPVEMVVDSECFVSQTFSACELDEFDISGGVVTNKQTGTTPGCLHFNGNSKDLILPKVLEMVNIR